jgi:hypothetical protein
MAMDHQSGRAINRSTHATILGLTMALGSVASAQTPTANTPVPLAFEPRQEMPSSQPARPVASTWGAYAIETHKRIEKHLKANRETFKYKSDLYVELWIDLNGRVTRTRVTGASGNRAADAMAGPAFPPGLILPPPAKDMPQPIKLKINADQ